MEREPEENQPPAPCATRHAPRPLWWYIATWFGAGLSPVASGTAGSLAALPFALAIHIFFGNFVLLAAAVGMFFIGWWASEKYLQHMQPPPPTPPVNGGGKYGDPKEIVVDEVAGQWLILAVLFPTWQSYLVGFLLFRLFDVVKPWPVSWADREVKGGLGVMLDDMLAALYPITVYLLLVIEAGIFGAERLFNPIMGFLGGNYVP